MSNRFGSAGVVNDERDEDSGEFTPKYADAEFVEALRTLGGTAGTSDVADEVGCPRRTAYHRLNQLRESGELEAREIGNSLAWAIKGGNDG